VARSSLRVLDAMLPADAVPLSVRDAVPTAVTGKTDHKAAVDQGFSGIWAAEMGLNNAAGSQRAAEQIQVAELFELA
jgi:hypothetical protein